jgi:hypothetical protein
MDTSVFEQIASSLMVNSICGSLGPDIPAGTDIEDLMSDPEFQRWDNPSRVINADGHVVGMLSFNDVMSYDVFYDEEMMEREDEVHDPYQFVDDIMDNIEPHRFLSSHTTILDAVELFCGDKQTCYYVISVNKIIGTLCYGDLFKPLGRLAFLALALEIEDQALKLCQSASSRDGCWQSLPDGRKRKAIDLFNRRYGAEPDLEPDPKSLFPKGPDILRLIECTELVDKATMIWKQKLINRGTGADVLGVFNKLKILRDRCAHPGRDGPPTELSKENLAHFINAARSMRSSLRDAMQAHGVGAEESWETLTIGDDGEAGADVTEVLARLKRITGALETEPPTAPLKPASEEQ